MSRYKGSIVQDLMAFEEWMERKQETLNRKKEDAEKKKKDDAKKREPRQMTFAEGMIVAILMQPIAGAVYKYVEHVLAVHQ